jgi:hypothetical protein
LKIKLNEKLGILEGVKNDYIEAIKAYAVLYKSICDKSQEDHDNWEGISEQDVEDFEKRVEEYKKEARGEIDEEEEK